MSSTLKKIRIGTRTSKLALTQVDEISALLKPHLGDIELEIIPIKTSGDKILHKNLADIGGKGLFIKELEEALITNKIDIAVHSAKDVPPFLHEKTHLIAFSQRLDSRDCFISKKYNSIEGLPQESVVGTSSARRKAILLRLRPDLNIINFRGNVTTRLQKLEDGVADATILAACAFERLSKNNSTICPKGYEIKHFIEKDVMLPAGGQGALAIQGRIADEELTNLIKKINHEESRICVKCERAFLRELGASCSTPVSVNAEITNGEVNLKTIIFDYDGSKIFSTNSTCKAQFDEAIQLGINAAKKTKKEAKKLLEKICS